MAADTLTIGTKCCGKQMVIRELDNLHHPERMVMDCLVCKKIHKVDLKEGIETIVTLYNKEVDGRSGCKCAVRPITGKVIRWCYTCGKEICNNCGDGYQCRECRFEI